MKGTEMTIDEFIEKWNVAYEDKEQEAEFASEMRDDIISILSLINTKNKMGLDDSLDDKSIEQPDSQEGLSNKKDMELPSDEQIEQFALENILEDDTVMTFNKIKRWIEGAIWMRDLMKK